MERNGDKYYLYLKVDKTLYQINVKHSDNAKQSLDDVILRLIANDLSTKTKENAINGKEKRGHNSAL